MTPKPDDGEEKKKKEKVKHTTDHLPTKIVEYHATPDRVGTNRMLLYKLRKIISHPSRVFK